MNMDTALFVLGVLLGGMMSIAQEAPIVSAVNGRVVIEAESAVSTGDWVKHGKRGSFDWLTGASGEGCLQFTGNSEHSGPPSSPLTYRFKIEEAGDYRLIARGLEAPLESKEGDKANDCYLRLVGGPQYKGEFTKFVLLGDSFEWSWNLKLESSYHHFESPYYALRQGVYQIQIAGRSKNLFLDRIVLFRVSDDAGARSLDLSPTLFDEPEPVSGAYVLSATSDFKPVDTGEGGKTYIDKNRRAIAVNAANESLRTVFSSVETAFKGKAGTYDVEIKTLTKTDGESPYRFFLNGTRVGNYKNPATVIDYSPSYHVWESVALRPGDRLRIDCKPHTNGRIPEGDGTAWSRGRWVSLTLSPTP